MVFEGNNFKFNVLLYLLKMANSAMGACGGPVLGIFLLGAIFPWANKHVSFRSIIYSCIVMYSIFHKI